MDLAPGLKRYLDSRSERELREVGHLINNMVEAGGDQQNAIETCLLEHASQVGCARALKAHLSPAAKKELG
jgi:hypothetical protein